MTSSEPSASHDMDSEEEINILLLGESGVGKSTFVNSCFNYLIYRTLEEVITNELQVLIPARIRIQDMNYEQQVIDLKVTDDQTHDYEVSNEVLAAGRAATQSVFSYVFLIDLGYKKCKVRFLDTPGLADERGTAKDQENCDLILAYLAQMKNFHGCCILLKPTNSRVDVMMNYCLIEILSRLEKSAVNNVAFVFTNSRGQNFTPGLTYAPLKVILKQIKEQKNIDIPLSRENTFCFDNEAFGYVAAVQGGVQLEEFIYGATETSWNKSYGEFWRMINYFARLMPHDLKKTITVNEARDMAGNLTEPLTEIMSIIQRNITAVAEQSKELSEAELTKEDLLKKFHTPQIDFHVTELSSPQTVCTEKGCASFHDVNGIRETHYKRKCCSECWISFITPEVVGNLALYACGAFAWDAYCRKCRHSLGTHKHIYYETEVIERETDDSIIPQMNSQEELVKFKEESLKSLEMRQQEYVNEKEYILQSCAVFDKYQKENSITPIGNPIQDYLKYQISREKAFSHGIDDKTVSSLQDLLLRYEQQKMFVQAAGPQLEELLSPDEVEKRIQTLLKLKHFGPRIRQLYELRRSGKKKVYKKRERVLKSRGGEWFSYKKLQDVLKIGKVAWEWGEVLKS